jgi:hypothetical protein
MPSLPQMYATCASKSYNSRSEGEIYSALTEAGFLVYAAVLKENSNFFIQFDTTTLTITPGVTTYNLPPDCTQVINIAERLSASERWRQLSTESIIQALDSPQLGDWWDAYAYNYGQSIFSYAGPFLPESNTVDQPSESSGGGFTGSGYQVQQIIISPTPTDTRFVELTYTAKWIPIVNSTSYVMLPDELTYAMVNYAVAELLRSNDDSLASAYEAKADKALAYALTWIRSRQIQSAPQIQPYCD